MTNEGPAARAQITCNGLRLASPILIIRAPFAGTITARYADPGDLPQNATTTQTAALPMVTVSKVDKLKVYA